MREPLHLGLGAAAAVAAAAAVYTVGAQAVAGGLRVGVVKRGPLRPMVALTFDDGPDPEHTPRILEALAAAGAHAAFFMVGRQVHAAPAVARAVAAGGHDLGNHTYGHRHLWTLSPGASVAEVDRGAEAVADATGTAPRYFRPPWGTFNWAAYVRARQIGEERILWSMRPEGWLFPSRASRMIAHVVQNAHPGAIIGLHDRGGHPSTPRETWTALPGMIAGLRGRGLQVVPLRALLGGMADVQR